MLSIVIPVFRNELSLTQLMDQIEDLQGEITDGLEAVFVIDGSPDKSYDILRSSLPQRRFPSALILLSRNFGSFAAIRAGLEFGTGSRFAVMAADMQEPPGLILAMDARLRSEPLDVVVGVRTGRADPLVARQLARLYWYIYRRFIVPDMPRGGVDVFACNRAFRDGLLRLQERHSSLIAQMFWLGFRRGMVTYYRLPRRHGKSAWTFSRKVEYVMDSVFAFTDLPIRLLVRLGGLTALLAGFFGAFVILAKIVGLIDVPGYAALTVLVTFFGALNLFCIGLVGSYAWRAYENTKARPLHVVLTHHEYPGTEVSDGD